MPDDRTASGLNGGSEAGPVRRALVPAATLLFAAVVFLADTLTPANIAFANFYAVVILLAARFLSVRRIGLVAAGCVALTVLSFALTPELAVLSLKLGAGERFEGAANMIISLGVIALTALVVTQYKTSEALLKEKADLLDLTHDTVFSRSIDDVITFWNKASEQMFGWARGEAIGRVSHELLRPKFAEPLDRIKAEVTRAGRWEGEAVYRKRDGAPIVVDSRWALQRDRDGRPALILETNTDITERKRAEDRLRLSEARFRTFVDHAIDGFLLLDEDAKILDVNREACASLGYGRDELIGMHAREVDVALDAEAIERRTLLGASIFTTRYRRKDGTEFPAEVHLAQFEQNGLRRRLALARDITERNRSAEALRDAAMQLAHANRVATMGQLTASIAHEILHPIATSRNNARAALRFLEMEPPEMAEVRDALECIVRDADRAKDIVDRIRNHMRKGAPQRDPVDLNEATEEVIALARTALDRNGVAVQTRMLERPVPVLGDRVQLQQVVLNLVMNAVEAMSAAEGERRLSIEVEESGDGVRVSVRDTGPGVDREQAERLFQPFHTTKAGGMGMGLAICRSIVEAHGGRLWADDNQARGAVFRFTIPAPRENS